MLKNEEESRDEGEDEKQKNTLKHTNSTHQFKSELAYYAKLYLHSVNI